MKEANQHKRNESVEEETVIEGDEENNENFAEEMESDEESNKNFDEEMGIEDDEESNKKFEGPSIRNSFVLDKPEEGKVRN